ncbi:MAG: transcriptional regulator domain-containing protein [Alphaproteobacteria bacterium]
MTVISPGRAGSVSMAIATFCDVGPEHRIDAKSQVRGSGVQQCRSGVLSRLRQCRCPICIFPNRVALTQVLRVFHESGGEQRMPGDDWRSPAAYDYLSDLSNGGAAFEFLRRNADYQADYAKADSEVALGAASGGTGLARRWGLGFSRRPGDPRRSSARLLAA